jgi:hypothetical protein
MVSSPDGNSLYTLSEGPGVSRIMIFRRGAGGRLRQPSGTDACLEWHAPGCRNARGFFDFGPPVVSPDGENVYVGTEDGWESFRRLRDSRLRQLPGRAGCAVDAEAIEIGGDDDGCRRTALLFAELVDISEGALVASHDGRHVYWGSNYALVAFRRSGG